MQTAGASIPDSPGSQSPSLIAAPDAAASCGMPSEGDVGVVRQKPRTYISGPMTGLPLLNFPAFHAAAASLRALGYDIVNPAEINTDQAATWEDCLRADIEQLVTCEAIALLPGWENSRGAKRELYEALGRGMRVTYVAHLMAREQAAL